MDAPLRHRHIIHKTPITLPTPPTTPSLPSTPASGPLSAAHLGELKAARGRAKKIRRVVAVAMFNGWTLAFAAAISLVILVFDRSLINLVLVAIITVFAVNELRGAAGVKRFEPASARMMGWNQLALAGAVLVYCSWRIWETKYHPKPRDPSGSAEVDAMLADYAGLETTITYAVYAAMALLGSFIPTLNANRRGGDIDV